tara:strand:+ start:391 stop:648 length:258 start_codon:yes stop_codon:yes gene_type:complete
MNKKQLKKEISLHYDDGISMNDPETAIENIILTIEENFINNDDVIRFANWYAYELKRFVFVGFSGQTSRETEPTLKEWKEQIKDL